MSVLAHALLDRGDRVSGSDAGDSAALAALRARGASVAVGQRAGNPDLAAADRVVLTGAVPATNPELADAQALGKPIVKRAAVLGALMDERTGVAIAGTHGKTTTTAMVAWILREAGRDPAFLVGGVISDLGTGGHWGGGPELVAEADEYDGSFWELRPQIAVITNIEADHLDYYADLAAIHESFRRFAEGLRPRGTLLICGDDPGAREMAVALAEAWAGAPGQGREVQLYGTTHASRWEARAEQPNAAGGTDFVVELDGDLAAAVSLPVPGHHNVLNALAAIGAATACGVPVETAAAALGHFHGTGRRFQRKGTTAHDVLVVDDYAHHPTEIAATLAAARRHLPDRRLVVVFQPHTYTRTKSFLPEFAHALAAADLVILPEIYAARETDTLGMSSQAIVDRLNAEVAGKAHYAANLPEATEVATRFLHPGDLLVTMGAGDVWKVGEALLQADSNHDKAGIK
jgi:UDP-N-acetylmuramate--alanine ligase